MQEEIFGPLLPVVVDDIDAAVRVIKDAEMPLNLPCSPRAAASGMDAYPPSGVLKRLIRTVL